MADIINKADYQDALSIEAGKIVVKGDEWGFVTGLSVDGKSPEDLIYCIGWTLRRRKPEMTEWSVDAAVLYDNLKALEDLKAGVKFDIIITFVNPASTPEPNNFGQQITIKECVIQDHSINIWESSTFRLSGRAKAWTVDTITA